MMLGKRGSPSQRPMRAVGTSDTRSLSGCWLRLDRRADDSGRPPHRAHRRAGLRQPSGVRSVATRFTVGLDRWARRKQRLQGLHLEHPSDALGAVASQLGPHARGLPPGCTPPWGSASGRIQPCARGSGCPSAPVCRHKGPPGARHGPGAGPTGDRRAAQRCPQGGDGRDRLAGRRPWCVAVGSDLEGGDRLRHGRGSGGTGRRRFEAAIVLLGEECSGTLVSGNGVVCRDDHTAVRQTCIAHMLRRWVELEVRPAGLDLSIWPTPGR